MNQKQLVLETIEHRPMDIVPYQINFSPGEHQKMAEYYDDANFLFSLGNAIDFVDPRPQKNVIKKDYTQDEFGVLFNKRRDKEVGVVEDFIVDADSVGVFVFPEVNEGGYFDQFETFLDGGRFNVVQSLHVFFERGWMLYGMENLLADMILRPKARDIHN